MSDSDSFIEEVSEEVRRDKLYAALRRYGWVGLLAILAVVAGTAWTSIQRDRADAEAQALGDGLLAALETNDPEARVAALSAVSDGSAAAMTVRDFLLAASEVEAGRTEDAIAALQRIEANGEQPLIYRQLASFKALTLGADVTDPDVRRAGFEALAQPGNPLRLLSEEQLALIEIETGNLSAAIDRLQAILSDAEATADLQGRALQVMVALGASPDLGGVPLGDQ